LLSGGVPGHIGGGGRPANLARFRAAEGALEGVKRMCYLIEHAKDESNQIRAFDALAKLMPQLVEEDPENPLNPVLSPAERLATIRKTLNL